MRLNVQILLSVEGDRVEAVRCQCGSGRAPRWRHLTRLIPGDRCVFVHFARSDTCVWITTPEFARSNRMDTLHEPDRSIAIFCGYDE